MVKAILEGRKTQTRRLIQFPARFSLPAVKAEWIPKTFPESVSGWVFDNHEGHVTKLGCPHGEVGNRLWAKENWRTRKQWDGIMPRELPLAPLIRGVDGKADMNDPDNWRYFREQFVHFEAEPEKNGTLHGKLRPSIFMPRWASRINLELTEIRVERLQEISEDDAKSEGVQFYAGYWSGCPHPIKGSPKYFNTPVQAFQSIWDFINGKRAPWASNPWVFAETFRRVE